MTELLREIGYSRQVDDGRIQVFGGGFGRALTKPPVVLKGPGECFKPAAGGTVR